ncbi:hypothetical protein [Bailinhaonella thermotolerans]|uniref:hypothetical protein n=1 Tax=Bailinhaonella thermotolerans TaxID=1070861 RepID=UPI00192A47C6|nr:hypothetical protein [Bailinhaonella thermotolerans]
MNRMSDRHFEVDVLALQALPGPSLGDDHAALGGATCHVLSVICCANTVCVGTY